MNPGVAAAVVAAALWAASSAALASQAGRLDSLTISFLRAFWASVFLILAVPALGATGDFQAVGIGAAIGLALSAMVGIGGGDTVYVAALGALGMTRAFTISLGVYTVCTYALAAVFLDETVTWRIAFGSALVVLGVYVVAILGRVRGPGELAPPAERIEEPKVWRGLALVSIAALAWAVATVWLRHAAGDTSPVVAGAIRVPAAGLLLGAAAFALPTSSLRLRNIPRRSGIVLAISGLIGTGMGSLLFIYAVQEAGAGRTAVITSISPLFALPLGAIFLRERITRWIVVGTILAVAGIVLLA
ncbi:MAG: DMT family transporter [Dehalococcoidia bacterium]